MKIALVQSEEETKFIKNQFPGEIIFVPFNLEITNIFNFK